MRGLAKRRPKGSTAKQLAVRSRFTLLSQFLLLIKGAVDRGFSNQYSGRATAFNLAIEANQGAFTGTDLDPQLDYSQIIISKGFIVPKPSDCKIAEGVQGYVTVSWKAFSGAVDNLDDSATIVLQCPEHMEALVYMDKFVRRDEVADLEIPSNWSQKTVHAYAFMTSKDGTNSATAFAGSLPIS